MKPKTTNKRTYPGFLFIKKWASNITIKKDVVIEDNTIDPNLSTIKPTCMPSLKTSKSKKNLETSSWLNSWFKSKKLSDVEAPTQEIKIVETGLLNLFMVLVKETQSTPMKSAPMTGVKGISQAMSVGRAIVELELM